MTETEKMRAAVVERRNRDGYKFSRQLRLDECKAYVERGLVPADALSASTFGKIKIIPAGLPSGSKCICCGRDLSGLGGAVVAIAANGQYATICAEDIATIQGTPEQGTPEPTQEPEPVPEVAPEPEPTPTPEPTAEPEPDAVSAALKTLETALRTPKPPEIDTGKIIAEAVSAARDEVRGVLQQTLADFLRNGVTTPTQAAPEPSLDAPEPSATGDGPTEAAKAQSWSADADARAVEAVEKLTAFLSEFSHFRDGVSARLVNTFARSPDRAQYLTAYCKVSAMEDAPELLEKMKSPEFQEVCNSFDALGKTPQPVNRRFAVFYGAPGGGKTFAARGVAAKANGDGKVQLVPCSPSMDAADTLYAYRLDYKSGRKGYIPTALLSAMRDGRVVVLDEINLLPMEARMFLQNILDNKDSVNVMGEEIAIKPGFMVIGTMNLETGNGTQPLPLPLCDRAAVIQEFRMTSAQCAVSAGLC